MRLQNLLLHLKHVDNHESQFHTIKALLYHRFLKPISVPKSDGEPEIQKKQSTEDLFYENAHTSIEVNTLQQS